MALKDNASLALIPVAYKTSKVYSVIPNDADGDFDFTRGSTGTRVNKAGLIETMPTNTPRLNYNILDGVVQGCPTLLLEPPKINIYTYSEDLSQGTALTNTTVDADSITSPSGALTGNKLTQTSGAFTRKNLGVILSGAYAWSFFAKKGDLRYLNARSLFVLNGTTPAYGNTIIDLDTNTIAYKGTNVTSASIEQYPNDWIKVEIVATDNATASGDFLDFFFTDNATSTQSTGVAGNGYIWGVQFESGNYGTSYIPNLTTGSTSRSTDAANGAGTSATFNDSEGVLFANIATLANDGTYSIISLSDNSSNNFIIIGYKDTTNRLFCDAIIGGTRFVSNPTTIVNQEQFNKICLKYKSGDTDIYFNGFKILSSSTTFTHSGNPISELEFRYFDNSLPFYGNTKELMTFNTALTDSELEALTSYSSFNEMATEQLYTIE
jgi:hypothetical protein